VTTDAAAIGLVRVDGEAHPGELVDNFTRPGNRLQPDRVWFGKQGHRGERFPAVNHGVANTLVKLLLGLGAKNRLVGRDDGAEHPVEPAHRPLAVLARGLAIEIVQRKGDIRRKSLEHRDNLGVDRSGFTPCDEEDADAAAIAHQRQGRRRADMSGGDTPAPRQRTRVVQEIITDAYFLVAKGLPANPGSLGRIGHDRNVDAAQACDVCAEPGGKPQQAGLGLQQKDSRRQEVSAGKCGFADLLVQLFR